MNLDYDIRTSTTLPGIYWPKDISLEVVKHKRMAMEFKYEH